MTWYNILILCSVPTIFSLVWQTVFSFFGDYGKKRKSLEKGVQALLRNELLTDYKRHIKNGEITMMEKENFANMYASYHNLGKNGVMTEYYEQVMALPIKQ